MWAKTSTPQRTLTTNFQPRYSSPMSFCLKIFQLKIIDLDQLLLWITLAYGLQVKPHQNFELRKFYMLKKIIKKSSTW
jgi:hypothetical protein